LDPNTFLVLECIAKFTYAYIMGFLYVEMFIIFLLFKNVKTQNLIFLLLCLKTNIFTFKVTEIYFSFWIEEKIGINENYEDIKLDGVPY